MKRFSIVAAAISILCGSAWAATPYKAASISELMDQIHKAPTPSEAIARYADAVSKAGTDVSVRRAFVLRMVELKHPEMVVEQARDISTIPGEGMAWAVMAFSEARQGHMDTAMTQVQTAVQESPTNEFVMITAGELVAWCDVEMKPATTVESTTEAIADVRSRLGSRRTFKHAYDDAKTMLESANVQVDPEAVDPSLWDQAIAARYGKVFVSNGGSGSTTPPLAIFYAAPYGLLPSYSSWYQPYGANVYYYSNWIDRGLGQTTPFPFPAVSADTRYLKLGGGAFALSNDDGTSIYQSLNYGGPIFAAPWGYPVYGYGGGYYGGGYYGGGGPVNFPVGRPIGRPGGFGNPRLNNRLPEPPTSFIGVIPPFSGFGIPAPAGRAGRFGR